MVLDTFLEHSTNVLAARDHVNPYGYVPTFGVCVLFVAIYGLASGERP